MRNEITQPKLFWVPNIARLTGRSERQVYRWVKSKKLRGRYRRLGGSAVELVFTDADVNRFLDLYLSPYDLEDDPQLDRLLSLMRKRAAKAREAAMAKRYERLR